MGCVCTRDAYKVVATNHKIKPNNNEEENKQSLLSKEVNTIVNPSGAQTNLNNVSLSRLEKLNKEYFVINIHFPEGKRQIIFNIKDSKEFILISDLLNKALFNNPDCDCNFISMYNTDKDKYEYKIERIVWKVKENVKNVTKNETEFNSKESHIEWKFFIDGNEDSFTNIINSNRVIHKEEIIDIKPSMKEV